MPPGQRARNCDPVRLRCVRWPLPRDPATLECGQRQPLAWTTPNDYGRRRDPGIDRRLGVLSGPVSPIGSLVSPLAGPVPLVTSPVALVSSLIAHSASYVALSGGLVALVGRLIPLRGGYVALSRGYVALSGGSVALFVGFVAPVRSPGPALPGLGPVSPIAQDRFPGIPAPTNQAVCRPRAADHPYLFGSQA